MKKKVIIAVCIIIATVLLFPVPVQLKDGGTVKYQAVLYSVSDVHCIALDEGSGFREGIIVEILGREVLNNVK